MLLIRNLLYFILFLLISSRSYSQDSVNITKISSPSDRLLFLVNKKTLSVTEKLSLKTGKYLNKLERKEKKLFRKMFRKDSLLARQTFGDIDSIYAKLKCGQGSNTKIYSGHIDSLLVAFRFLGKRDISNVSNIQQNLDAYGNLQKKLDATEYIKKELAKRQKMLKEQFSRLGMVKELKSIQRTIYYYNAQLKEYKTLFENPSKAEQKIMELVMQIPGFKEYFKTNSRLGQLFALPGTSNVSMASLAGLQTRNSVNQLLVNRFGSSASSTQALQQQMQSAQAEMNQLKTRLAGFQNGSFGNGSADLPEGFKPNTQKTKSFFKRLEYGFNVQSQRSRTYFPTTSDLGLSLGYKMNDRSIIGIGLSYKLGLGRGWDHISFSHEGIGLRSYVDIKMKRNLWITGGYEKNYLSGFKNITVLSEKNGWQQSGLIGISKQYKVSKKFKGEMKLMWDFLSYRQVPRTQAVVFRVGYKLK